LLVLMIWRILWPVRRFTQELLRCLWSKNNANWRRYSESYGFDLLGCFAASVGSLLPKFRDTVSVTDYPRTLRRIPEERRHGESKNSPKIQLLFMLQMTIELCVCVGGGGGQIVFCVLSTHKGFMETGIVPIHLIVRRSTKLIFFSQPHDSDREFCRAGWTLSSMKLDNTGFCYLRLRKPSLSAEKFVLLLTFTGMSTVS
jgi:hypothetical protein